MIDKFLLSTLALLILFTPSSLEAQVKNTKRNVESFDSADEALAALKSAIASEDPERLVELYGEQARSVIITGDEAADRAMMRRLNRRFEERAQLIDVVNPEYDGEQWFKVRYGKMGWDMYIPLVYRQEKWLFASEVALDAAKRTRKAINEVTTLDTLRALIAAQQRFRQEDLNKNGVPDYAQKILSSPNTRDGLYWSAEMDGEYSPLEGLVQQAIADGYKHDSDGPPNYEGYYYRVLKGQGKGARGGAKSYMKGDNMVNGFAFLAYPVKWNASGMNTFVVGDNGQIWKKDLGFRTESIAEDMDKMEYNHTWARVEYSTVGEDKSRRGW